MSTVLHCISVERKADVAGKRSHFRAWPRPSSGSMPYVNEIFSIIVSLQQFRLLQFLSIMNTLKVAYPWMKFPYVVSAPMLGAANPRLAVNVSRAGGMGFIAGGSSAEKLDDMLEQATTLSKSSSPSSMKETPGTVPIGVGFQLFNCSLDSLAEVIANHIPAAIWLFAPGVEDDFRLWANKLRAVTKGKTRIWIQVGSVAEAKQGLYLANPDVLITQGSDAGGHGQHRSASIVSLVPEVVDMLKNAGRSEIPVLAAGGIVDGRGCAAALTLGASGAVMGTRFLVAEESSIAPGWKHEILRSQDGGVSTLRSTLCDRLKETKGWPSQYDGRVIKNKGHKDEEAGMPEEENVKRYKEELKQGDHAWGPHGRMVAYAGTGVGLIKQPERAERMVNEILSETRHVLERSAQAVADGIAHSRL